MLLDRYDLDALNVASDDVNPLIVTKETARKALFEKLNRSGGLSTSRGSKRITQRGLMLRGNSFVGQRYGQRVVVKIRYVKHKPGSISAGGGASALRDHVRYISRPGAGKDGEKAVLFDAGTDGLGRKDFVSICQNDRHHFRFIISPENGHDINDFQLYVRNVMGLVEKDLGTKLEWISAAHFDTEDPHAHVIVRGRNDRGQDLVIGQDYIKEGIRKRAQEVATELLGERSLEDIQKSLEKEVNAMRVTSLDRFIEKQADAKRAIDVRARQNFGQSLFYEGVIKGRLKFLAGAGLAQENPPGIYTLKEDYQDVLSQIATKDDIVKRLYNKVELPIEGLSIYSMKSGEGPTVEGRVIAKGFYDEITDRKFIVVKEATGKLHYVPMGEFKRYDDLEEGSLVRVRPGEAGTGKADYNIATMAEINQGVYDPRQHLAHIERHQQYIAADERSKYLEAHIIRLGTLEKNGVVEPLGDGRYSVPKDIIAKGEEITRAINEREKKRFYPITTILSATPPEKLVSAPKKTWLDKELYKHSTGKLPPVAYDSEINAALSKRREWLVKHDLAIIQSNGTFALRDNALRKLDKLEVYNAGRGVAKKMGIEFNDAQVHINTVMRYEGHIELETGPWAVISRGNSLHLAPASEKAGIDPGAQIIFQKKDEKTFEMHHALKKVQAKNKDQDREL